jgi:hypothetical protein
MKTLFYQQIFPDENLSENRRFEKADLVVTVDDEGMLNGIEKSRQFMTISVKPLFTLAMAVKEAVKNFNEGE